MIVNHECVSLSENLARLRHLQLLANFVMFDLPCGITLAADGIRRRSESGRSLSVLATCRAPDHPSQQQSPVALHATTCRSPGDDAAVYLCSRAAIESEAKRQWHQWKVPPPELQ